VKVAILAGGLGTRLQEETVSRPKPMVEIGGRPIRWHIMKMYEAAGLDDFVVALIETGTGGRVKRLGPQLGGETFCLTHGDGVADVDIRAVIDFHRRHGKAVTLTAVRPTARFGHLELEGDRVAVFDEKPQTGEGWINGAFLVCEPRLLDDITDDAQMLEREPLERVAKDGELMAYRHEGFWQCMDTMRDKVRLEEMWQSGAPPWKTWT